MVGGMDGVEETTTPCGAYVAVESGRDVASGVSVSVISRGKTVCPGERVAVGAVGSSD